MPAVTDTLVIVGGINRMIDLRRKTQIIPRMEHGSPLEGSEGLGDKEGCTHRDLASSIPFGLGHLFIIGRRNPIGQIRDSNPVL